MNTTTPRASFADKFLAHLAFMEGGCGEMAALSITLQDFGFDTDDMDRLGDILESARGPTGPDKNLPPTREERAAWDIDEQAYRKYARRMLEMLEGRGGRGDVEISLSPGYWVDNEVAVKQFKEDVKP